MRDAEEAVYTTISRALLAGRLAPGTPLREPALAEVFGISRERVRKILQRLGTNRLIELVPNRGAFVAMPSLEQARDIYEARRILEVGIVGHLAPMLGDADADRLRRHLQREAEAMRADDRAESVRLSAQFHVLLAEATGNVFVVQQMQELVSRTSMLVAVYESAGAAQCGCDEHQDIFTSLLKGDGTGAGKAMRAHLSLIETRLKPRVREPDRDAATVLRAIWAETMAGTS
ncbi:GntR family transcriptional regulator [Xylophilus sp. GOD-11R]|uniref:GntR family transcriptional regulator n=1 Tax=Xylophilus sp. GOD-11R TaxID=3089814 RepID=UPI00298C3760|nr:GntR family transcriptional regulator [Xylophilus sp. GOD-11R]WPB55302.1 GntR family transcriptional regulator [Xylophilus sp. GOD-11R]